MIFAPSAHPPRLLRRRAHQQRLLATHQDLRAALAWCGFKTLGRGALISPAPVSLLRHGALALPIGPHPTGYVPLAQLLTIAPLLPPNGGAAIAAMARTYHPDQEIVVVFLSPHGSIDAYSVRLPSADAPPLAYLRWAAVLQRVISA